MKVFRTFAKCLFPACAGVINQQMRIVNLMKPFPRMCGGDPGIEWH